MKFFVTIPMPERFTYPNAVEVEADTRLEAIAAIGATVWTDAEWTDAQKVLGARK